MFEELIEVLKRLHARRQQKKLWTGDGKRMRDCRRVMMRFLEDHEVIAQKRVSEHLDSLENYYVKKIPLKKL